MMVMMVVLVQSINGRIVSRSPHTQLRDDNDFTSTHPCMSSSRSNDCLNDIAFIIKHFWYISLQQVLVWMVMVMLARVLPLPSWTGSMLGSDGTAQYVPVLCTTTISSTISTTINHHHQHHQPRVLAAGHTCCRHDHCDADHQRLTATTRAGCDVNRSLTVKLNSLVQVQVRVSRWWLLLLLLLWWLWWHRTYPLEYNERTVLWKQPNHVVVFFVLVLNIYSSHTICIDCSSWSCW